jgi:anhydro-N-acetylmuramic acid kinase
MRVAGIMSGTSLDGIDVAIVDLDAKLKPKVRAFSTTPYPAALRKRLLAVSNCECHTRDIARLHFELAERYAAAVAATCGTHGIKPSSIELVGCHGQTIYHEGGVATLQIGEGSVLAERLGIPVLSDFRPRDIAAGGQGAPLVPFVDWLLLRHPKRGRVALNIGGIANITAIPPSAAQEDVVAFDTGPGNMVIDQLVERHTNGKQRFDRGGRLAGKGAVNDALLEELMCDAFYRRLPPKSAGREQYGAAFIDRLLAANLPTQDLVATATTLTALTIATAVISFVPHRVDDLVVSGGGVHNPRLMAYLAGFLPGARVLSSAEFGIDPDAKEAIAFAMLAAATMSGVCGNLPKVTGARRSVLLGKLAPASRGTNVRD